MKIKRGLITDILIQLGVIARTGLSARLAAKVISEDGLVCIIRRSTIPNYRIPVVVQRALLWPLTVRECNIYCSKSNQ